MDAADKMPGTFGAKIDPTSRILEAARKSASMGMPDTSGMLGLNAGQALADTLQKGLFPDIPNAADALLGSLPGFAEMFAETERRRQEALDFYRPQAYERITPADIDHAIPRIDWAAFMAAQWPSLTEKEEAETNQRQAPVIEERTQLATALDSRLKERAVQERAALELLAYAWATWGGYEEGDGIPEMMARFLPDDADWASLSDTELEPEYLRKILEAPGYLPAMAPAFQNGWGRTTSVALMQYGLPTMMAPWKGGDRREWPETLCQWQDGKSWFRLTFDKDPLSRGTDKQREAAWELSDNLSPWVGFVAFAIAMIYQRNKKHGGRIVTDIREILRTLNRHRPGKGFRADDKRQVSSAMYTLSQLRVQQLRYLHRQSRKHNPELREAPARHWLTYEILEQSGDDATYDVWLGEPLLQMVADFPGQVAHVLEGSITPDGRAPHLAIWAMLLPLKARSHRTTFTEHGLPIRDLLILGGIDPDKIDPRKRSWWKRTLPKDLDNLPILEKWNYKTPPGWRWEEWLATRIILHVRREHTRDAEEEGPASAA